MGVLIQITAYTVLLQLGFLHVSAILRVAPGDGETNMRVLPGESATMICVISGNELDIGLTHSIQWRKFQDPNDNKGVVFALGTSLDGIFKELKDRVHSNSEREAQPEQKITISWTISDLKPEDSGRYMCQLSGEGAPSGATVDFHIKVFDQVENIIMSGYRDAMNPPEVIETNQRQLVYYNNKNGYFECSALGGYPDPTLRLMVGEQQITGIDGIQNQREVVLSTDGEEGMQRFNTSTRLVSNKFKLSPKYDGKELRCEGFVHDQLPLATVGATLAIFYEPEKVEAEQDESGVFMDHCPDRITAPVGATAFEINCRIRSKPFPSITWTSQDTQEVTEGGAVKSATGLEAMVVNVDAIMDNDNRNIYTAKLVFDTVTQDMYTDYVLTVTNDVGTTDITIKLGSGPVGGETSASAKSSLSAITCVVLLVISLLSYL